MATTTSVPEESLAFALPQDFLAELSSFTHGPVDLDLRDGQLIVTRRRRLSLNEMLDQCDPNAPMSEEDKAWVNLRPAGRELL